MPVFRVEKNTNYTTMCNYHLRDRNLTLKAKGLLRDNVYVIYEMPQQDVSPPKAENPAQDIRLRSLGGGYSEEEIRAVLAGAREHQLKRRKKEKQFSAAPPKLQLLIDVEAKRAQGKGGGYVRWAKSFNLQQMAEAVCFIKEHDIGTYDELVERTDAATARFNELSDSIKSAEQRLAQIAALRNTSSTTPERRRPMQPTRSPGTAKSSWRNTVRRLPFTKRHSISLTELLPKKEVKPKSLPSNSSTRSMPRC